MTCRFCRAGAGEGDHRCQHCGRRLRSASSVQHSAPFPITTATAPQLEMDEERITEPRPLARPEIKDRPRISYQPSLFREMQTVIPMPSSNPPAARRASGRPSQSRARKTPEGQQSLDFPSDLPVLGGTPVETAVYCNAPVALPVHRALAAALDAAVIVLAMTVFLVTFSIGGGEIVFDRQTIPLFIGIATVLGLFYHFLFCLSGGDSPGMRWTQLRMLNFDGQPPDREQRSFRLAASCLSVVAAGLGIVWALVDEESLTWHDHMSKTFPSPYGQAPKEI